MQMGFPIIVHGNLIEWFPQSIDKSLQEGTPFGTVYFMSPYVCNKGAHFEIT